MIRGNVLSAFIVLLLISCGSPAQVSALDSLKNLLKSAGEDTLKVTVYNELSDKLWRTGEYEEALRTVDQATALATKINDKNGFAKGIGIKGIIYLMQGDYDKSVEYLQQALTLKRALGDSIGVAGTYNNIGSNYLRKGEFVPSLNYYLCALRLYESNINENTDFKTLNSYANTVSNLGNIQTHQKNYAEADMYFDKALGICMKLNEKYKDQPLLLRSIGNIYVNKGVIQLYKHNYEKLFEYDQKALEYLTLINDKQAIASVKNALGNARLEKKEYRKARELYEEANKTYEEIGEKNGIILTLNNIAFSYTGEKKYAESNKYFEKALAIAKENTSREWLMRAYEGLCDNETAVGHHEAALNYYKLFIGYRDSLRNEENVRAITRSSMQYEFAKKEAAAKLEQEKKEALAGAESKKQKIIIGSVSIALLMVLFFAVFVYRSFLQKKKINVEISKQKEIIEQKQKEIVDSIKYARRIQQALVTSEKYIDKNLDRLTGKS